MPSLAQSPTVSATDGSQAMTVSLDSCRNMALRSNKQLLLRGEAVNAAHYDNRAAFAAYLPSIDFAGGYTYNQKKISIFDSDQLLPTKTFDPATQKYEFNLAKNPLTGELLKQPDGQYVPETVALIPKEAMTYDIHNVFFGAVTLTQPVYMGGKIVAMNRLTHFAEELAREMRSNEAQNIVYAVDAAYWQVSRSRPSRNSHSATWRCSTPCAPTSRPWSMKAWPPVPTC